jgi:hypothetical protein
VNGRDGGGGSPFSDRATPNRTIFIFDPFPFIYLDPPSFSI